MRKRKKIYEEERITRAGSTVNTAAFLVKVFIRHVNYLFQGDKLLLYQWKKALTVTVVWKDDANVVMSFESPDTVTSVTQHQPQISCLSIFLLVLRNI